MWGDDFRFTNPGVNFKNMETLMQYIIDHRDTYNVNMRFATISEYMRYGILKKWAVVLNCTCFLLAPLSKDCKRVALTLL